MGPRSLVVIAILAGCDGIFDLEAVPDPSGTDGGGRDGSLTCSETVGHDEDRDKIDDACDPCPGDADTSSGDTDGDGIDDVCDPRDGMPDTLTTFFAFATPGDADHWNQTSDWSEQQDAFVCAALAKSSTYIELVDDPPSLPFAIEAGITLADVDRTMYDQISFSANVGSGGDTLSCTFSHAFNGAVHTETWTASGSSDVPQPVMVNTYAAGTTLVLRMRFTPTGADCRLVATRDDGQTVVSDSSAAATSATAGAIAINVQRTTLRLEWLAIYGAAPQ